MKDYKNLKICEIQVTYKPKKAHRPQICSSEDAYRVLKSIYNEETLAFREEFYMLCLNRANRVIGYFHVSTGTVKGTLVDVAQLIAVAIKANSSSIIISHSHPSGNLSASQADIDLTRDIKKVCDLLKICLLDHIIVTLDNGYTSFADEDLF